jgi:hypothetical protein
MSESGKMRFRRPPVCGKCAQPMASMDEQIHADCACCCVVGFASNPPSGAVAEPGSEFQSAYPSSSHPNHSFVAG